MQPLALVHALRVISHRLTLAIFLVNLRPILGRISTIRFALSIVSRHLDTANDWRAGERPSSCSVSGPFKLR